MTDERLELELAGIYATRLAHPAPDRLVARVTSIAAVSGGPAEQLARRFGQPFSALRPVAATGFVVLMTAFVLNSVGVPGSSREVAAPAASTAPSPSASAVPSPTAEAATELGSGPALGWERVDLGFELAHPYGGPGPGWFDGRFYVSGRAKDAWASSDGLRWVPTDDPHPWHGERVLRFGDRLVRAGRESSILMIEEPDGTSTQHDFRGRIDQVWTSPAGVIVLESLDHVQVIQDVLGPEVAQGDWRIVSERKRLPSGVHDHIYVIETSDGERERIALSEHGDLDWANARVARAWFSPDGVEWTPTGTFPGWEQQGTEAGFWAGDDSTLLHSADGLDWGRVAKGRVAKVHDASVVAWRDGALLFDQWRTGPERGRAHRRNRISALTPDSISELPMSTALLGADWRLDRSGWAVGPLGLVSIDGERVVFSPDGVDWSLRDVPATWREPGWWTSSVAVGADAVLVGLQRCSDPAFNVEGCPSEAGIETQLWRGTVVP